MDEAALTAVLQRVRAGDAEAWVILYRRFSRRIFGLCRHLLGAQEAADATSEVFLRAHRAMKSYDASQPFPRWLLSIASHYCVDELRRRSAARRIFGAEEAPAPEAEAATPSPLAELLGEEERAAVRAAVTDLPERLRVPLVLRYYNEMSYVEIAEALGWPRNTVANLIFRAKKELRRALARRKERVQ